MTAGLNARVKTDNATLHTRLTAALVDDQVAVIGGVAGKPGRPPA